MTEWQAKKKTMSHYDCIVSNYDTLYAQEQSRQIKTALKYINLQRRDIVIDVGCGTGLLFSCLRKKIALLVGVDLSRGILRQAKRQAKRDKNIVLVCADADYMPFVNAAFNLAFAITIMQNMPHANKILKEVKRVLKPESLLAVTGLKKKYTLEDFTEILREAKLEIKALEDDEDLKGYVAICKL